jgi:hypothetical protein
MGGEAAEASVYRATRRKPYAVCHHPLFDGKSGGSGGVCTNMRTKCAGIHVNECPGLMEITRMRLETG